MNLNKNMKLMYLTRSLYLTSQLDNIETVKYPCIYLGSTMPECEYIKFELYMFAVPLTDINKTRGWVEYKLTKL